ncbi:glutamate receptor ionotropic, delta-1-like [Eriocheir sinensis]|uniref:glutamate receptor ionotropic, delta-1-like n=1 Tax=Eriocheir sinensis TaxID=95602 RepID=UPI0021C9C04C|nr:glutamate receptor ionotropic, delta-1-like [Eriocheir sinensis]XP_050699127.1 glutamate receptor ionotropic, delta-1-like [Eriocheir sinensis]
MRSTAAKKTVHLVGIAKVKGGWEVYTNQLFREPPMRRITSWRHNGGGGGGGEKRWKATRLFSPKITNLQGAKLKVGWFQFSPHSMIDRRGQKYGRDYHVAMALSTALNFTPVFKQPVDGKLWGSLLENGSFSGLVGDVGRGDVDFALANIFITDADTRCRVMDFSNFYDSDVACFMGPAVGPLPRWQSLALPFTVHTWLAILAALVFGCVSLYALASVSQRSYAHYAHIRLSSVILYTWGIHTRVPQMGEVKIASVRVAVLALWLYAVVLTVAYSTNLTASLTVAKTAPAINTFRFWQIGSCPSRTCPLPWLLWKQVRESSYIPENTLNSWSVAGTHPTARPPCGY